MIPLVWGPGDRCVAGGRLGVVEKVFAAGHALHGMARVRWVDGWRGNPLVWVRDLEMVPVSKLGRR